MSEHDSIGIDNCPSIPFIEGKILLKISGFGVRNNLGHPVHVFTRTGLHQAAGVLPGLIRDIMSVGKKMFAEIFHKRYKTTTSDGQCRLRGGICISPWVTVLFLSSGSLSCKKL
jgi:hypothetical protein